MKKEFSELSQSIKQRTELLMDVAFDSISDKNVAHDSLVAQCIGKNNDQSDLMAGKSNVVYGIDFADIDANDMVIFQDSAAIKSYAKDVDTYGFNLPSAGVPSWFTTAWTTKMIKQLLQTRPFYTMTKPFQQGQFSTSNIKISTMSYSGSAAVYDDYSSVGATSNNYNWVDRQTITLQQLVQYGDLATARMGMAKIDFVANLNATVADKINLDINQIGFSGYAGVKCFGLLNDPSLNPQIVLPTSASNPSSTSWAYKSGVEIGNDVYLLVSSIVALAGGNFDPSNAKMFLGVPSASYNYLLQPYSAVFPMTTVEGWLKSVYKGLEIIQVPNYQGTGTAGANYMQLVLSELGGEDVALNAFCSLFMDHGTVRTLSAYESKKSYTVGACIVVQPIGVATAQGI